MATKHDLTSVSVGDFYEGTVKIFRRTQPGPVIFVVGDGGGSIDAVTKESPFAVDDVVDIKGVVTERAGKLQLEIRDMQASNLDFDTLLDKKSIPVRTTCSISLDRYDALLDRFIALATRIRKAILSNQPIMIRHHADADGIISGLAIEQACQGLMEHVGVKPEYNLFRSPSRAPYYAIGDVLRDIVLTQRLLVGKGQKKPLILVLDNGSTPEDAFGIQSLALLDYEIAVIDHHNPVTITDGKSIVCRYLSHHVNPYLVGYDGQVCAGMLCYEVARMIWEEFDEPRYPAVAGISDRSATDITQQYVDCCPNVARGALEAMGTAIDFLAYHLKHDAGKGVYEEIFHKPDFVTLVNEQIREGIETQLQSTLPYLRTQELNGIVLSHIDLEKYTLRFTYPTPGKVIGMVHDIVTVSHEHQPVLSLGLLSDMIIIRANQPVLPVQEIIDSLQKNFPAANVDGGGHECAGTIKFVPAHADAVLEHIKQMLRNREKE